MLSHSGSSVEGICACKGVRRCLRCEQVKGKAAFETNYPEVIIALDKTHLFGFIRTKLPQFSCPYVSSGL